MRFWKWACYWLVLAAFSAMVCVSFARPGVTHIGLNQFSPSKFLELVDGVGHRPFQYRVLVPFTIRVATRLTPAAVQDSIRRRMEGSPRATRWFHDLYWETDAAFQYLVLAALMFASFLLFGHVASGAALRLCGLANRAATRAVLGSFALVGLVPMFRFSSYLYDPAQILLFGLAFHALVVRSDATYASVFLLCCLNKETAALLVPLYVVGRWRRGLRRPEWLLAGALAVTYVVIRGLIVWQFRHNPGGLVEHHLGHNVRWLTHGWSFDELAPGLLLAGLLAYRWQDKPALARHAFLVLLLPLLALTLFFGFLDEWRDYYEAYLPGFILVVDSLWRLGRRLQPEADRAEP